MRKKIIVLGANGMAGHVITYGLSMDSAFEVISVARSYSLIYPDVILDISDFSSLKALINSVNADVIINCIGILNKAAEINPDQAILINTYLPHFLEAQTRLTKTKVIHLSTDCVFSGKKGDYTENEIKDGSGFYSKSKALGELENSKDLTFRTSIIGPELNLNGIGLFHWFSGQEGIINGYLNAFWTGITTIELLSAIKIAICEDLTGLYHLVNNFKISKFELLNLFNVKFNAGLIIKPNSEYEVDKSLLNTRSDFSFRVKSYEEMVSEMKNWIDINKKLYPHYNKN